MRRSHQPRFTGSKKFEFFLVGTGFSSRASGSNFFFRAIPFLSPAIPPENPTGDLPATASLRRLESLRRPPSLRRPSHNIVSHSGDQIGPPAIRSDLGRVGASRSDLRRPSHTIISHSGEQIRAPATSGDLRKEIPAAAKFREKGLYLPDEMEIVFGDVVAKGQTAWAPSLGNLPPQIGASTQVCSDHAEGSGDSDDKNIGSEFPNLNLDAPSDIPPGASTYSPPAGDRDGGRKKTRGRVICVILVGLSRKHNSSSSSVSDSLEKLAGALVESNKANVNDISAADCMKVVSSLPIDRKSKFFYKCLTVLMKNREYREMLMTMEDPEMQLLYLETLVEENS